MFETIQCHKDFFSGSRDSHFHVDIPKLTADEYARLEAFIDLVLDAEELPGRNKPSHTDENGKKQSRWKWLTLMYRMNLQV